MDQLLAAGIRYAFISNCDNLGARLEPGLLGYFAVNDFAFMMEVAEKTPADLKGGHLARRTDGRLILREAAQCPEDETDAFQDIERYRYFNTNNIWVRLDRIHAKPDRHRRGREGSIPVRCWAARWPVSIRPEESWGIYAA